VVFGGLRNARMGRALRRHPVAVDAVLAVLLGMVAVPVFVGSPDNEPLPGALAMVAAALFLPLIWRRRFPASVFAVIAAAAFAQWLLGARRLEQCDIPLLVAYYTVASRCTRRVTLAAGAVLGVGILLAVLGWSPDTNKARLSALILLSAVSITAGVLGINVGTRRAYLAALEDRAARLERERDQQAQIAAAAERARIAREMHDVVAHNLSVMIALADGATFALERSPHQAEQAILAVSATGREALAEMRGLLGVLRDEASPEGTAPQPRLTDIDELVEQVRRAGLPVTLRIDGSARAFSAGVQLTVFRIVQESLTNTLKHGGPGAAAEVRLRYDDIGVDVEITDSGRGAAAGWGAAAGAGRTGGRGIAGMRERTAVHGGTVVAGPKPDGGWRVRARVNGDGEPRRTGHQPGGTLPQPEPAVRPEPAADGRPDPVVA
jgi:signal transduction histidine kinase